MKSQVVPLNFDGMAFHHDFRGVVFRSWDSGASSRFLIAAGPWREKSGSTTCSPSIADYATRAEFNGGCFSIFKILQQQNAHIQKKWKVGEKITVSIFPGGLIQLRNSNVVGRVCLSKKYTLIRFDAPLIVCKYADEPSFATRRVKNDLSSNAALRHQRHCKKQH